MCPIPNVFQEFDLDNLRFASLQTKTASPLILLMNMILQWLICIDIPRAPMTSIFEGQPPQNKAFSNQNKGHVGF